jgi:hypothetical protein
MLAAAVCCVDTKRWYLQPAGMVEQAGPGKLLSMNLSLQARHTSDPPGLELCRIMQLLHRYFWRPKHTSQPVWHTTGEQLPNNSLAGMQNCASVCTQSSRLSRMDLDIALKS